MENSILFLEHGLGWFFSGVGTRLLIECFHRRRRVISDRTFDKFERTYRILREAEDHEFKWSGSAVTLKHISAGTFLTSGRNYHNPVRGSWEGSMTLSQR